MDFGQAVSALLNGSTITRSGWQRQGMQLGLQAPTGAITQPFLFRRLANGETSVYCPDQADILANDWSVVTQGATSNERRQHEHAAA